MKNIDPYQKILARLRGWGDAAGSRPMQNLKFKGQTNSELQDSYNAGYFDGKISRRDYHQKMAAAHDIAWNPIKANRPQDLTESTWPGKTT